jgi:hypothetical protein
VWASAEEQSAADTAQGEAGGPNREFIISIPILVGDPRLATKKQRPKGKQYF